MSSVNIFEQLMEMSELNPLLVLLSQEKFRFFSVILIISKPFFEITIPK